MRKSVLSLLVLALTLVVSLRSANAQQYEITCNTVSDCATDGTQLFRDEHFIEAALVLQAAYDMEANDVLLYNIARAYQRANRCVPASEFFLRYLATENQDARSGAEQHQPDQTACAERYEGVMQQVDEAINGQLWDRALELIAEARGISDEPEARLLYLQTLLNMGGEANCQQVIASIDEFNGFVDFNDQQATELQSDRSQADQCLANISNQARQQECEAERTRAEDEWRAGMAGQQMIGLIVTGVGGAILIGAVVHDIISQGTISDYESAAELGNAEDFNSLRDSIDSAKTLSIILYSAGGVVTIAGVVVYLLAGGSNPADAMDCTNVSWDFGFGTPQGDAGFWFSTAF